MCPLNSEITDINSELALSEFTSTGNYVNLRYEKSGKIVTVTSASDAKADMTAGTTYPLNYTMPYIPANEKGFEAFCRNGVEAYFNIDPSGSPMAYFVPRSNISVGSSMAFTFTYICE